MGGDAEQPAAEGCGNGQTLVVNLPEEPVSLDGNYDTLVVPAQINQNLYDGLFTFGPTLEVEPGLATDYEQVDPTTVRLQLREDVTFHDGSPFTSADVVNSFDRIAKDEELASKQKSYVNNIESVEADGDYAVVFHLVQPDSSFIRNLASLIFITPKGTIDEKGVSDFATSPVGTGPFKFVEWVKGDHLTMEANCEYWRGAPQVSKVEWRFISEPATALASLRSGQIDLAPLVPKDLADPLAGDAELEVKEVQGNRNIWVIVNSLEGPLSDVRVRQALNYAIDKEAIVDELLAGAGVPSGQPANPSVFGYNESVEPYPYDPDRARQLLEEAGYADGLNIEFYNDKPIQELAWQAVGEQLKAVGIDVELKTDQNYFPNTYLAQEMGPNTIFIGGCSNQMLDADYCLGLWFDSARRGLYYNNDQVDELIWAARASDDEAKREELYAELMQLLHDEAPVIYLYSNIDTYAMKNSVNFTPRGDQKIWLWDVTKG